MSRKNNREPFNIPTITESLRREVLSGRITLWQAASELCQAGWSNFVDVEKTKRLLDLEDISTKFKIGDAVRLRDGSVHRICDIVPFHGHPTEPGTFYIKYDLDFKDGRTHLFDEKDLVAA